MLLLSSIIQSVEYLTSSYWQQNQNQIVLNVKHEKFTNKIKYEPINFILKT